ncbi:MAG: Fic family protein [Candidatus Methanoplasma sp.]|jgi:Fic family protein|nr:Fic family protein [Candidatus Methanoplasma sp.]
MRMPKTPPSVQEKFRELGNRDVDPVSYIKAAARHNSGYPHWDTLRHKVEEGLEPELVWAFMKMMRENNFRYVSVDNIEIKYSVTEEFQKIIHDIDIRVPNGLSPEKGLNEKEMRMYSISSIMEEAIASSQMEGASTTRQAAKRMLRENRRPKDRSEWMIFNNYEAMRLIKGSKDRDLTSDLILEIHKEITKNTMEDHDFEGRYRNTDDIVVSDLYSGDVYHTPIDCGDISRAIDALCEYVNDDGTFTHPLIKGTVIHYLIGYIHPFTDGNGRLARSLFYWYLLKKGYRIVEFLSISRVIKKNKSKYDWSYLLSETDDNDITYFIKFNLQKVQEALDDFLGYIETERKERQEFESAVSERYCLNMRQKMMIADAMKSGEPFSIQEMQSKFQVTYQTARTDVMKLEEVGMVKKAGKRSNQILYSISEEKKKSSKDGNRGPA